VATQHDCCVAEDYRLLREVGIYVAREAIRWPLVDRQGRYDFSTVQPILEASRRYGLQVIFDLFHFGYPEDVDLFSAAFPKRFADYCYAAARYVAAHSEKPGYFTPVNEPSYFAHAGGEVGLFAPHHRDRGWELKRQLIRAAIQGIEAIWAACPGARIVNVDSMCHVVAPPDRPDLQQEADDYNSIYVYEGWDMLSGRMAPELGGSPRHLDIVGINYYWTNQWEIRKEGIPLADGDLRCWPLRRLVRAVWERYRTDVVITETSHVDEMRPRWLYQLTDEAQDLLNEDVPLRGVCLYPILGMPEWHAQHLWTRMGLWDLQPENGALRRVICRPMLQALQAAQQRLEGRWSRPKPRRHDEPGRSFGLGADVSQSGLSSRLS
jgi:hypothetical protein